MSDFYLKALVFFVYSFLLLFGGVLIGYYRGWCDAKATGEQP